MIRYNLNNDTEIYLTNDIDIFIIQNKNPNSQENFKNKDEAIAWAEDYAKEFNEILVASYIKTEEPSEIDKLKDKIEHNEVIVNSLSDTIVEMSINMSI